MKSRWVRAVIALAAVGLAALGGWVLLRSPYDTIENVVSPDDAGLRVLFVGNSHTSAYRVPRMIAKLAPEGEKPIYFDVLAAAWRDLRWHRSQGVVAERLSSSTFDVVVLQTLPSEVLEAPATHREIVDEIRGMTDARVLVWVPWPHPEDGNVASAMDSIRANLSWDPTAVDVGGLMVKAADQGIAVFDEDGVHATPLGSVVTAVKMCSAIYQVPESRCLDTPYGSRAEVEPVVGLFSEQP